ncbi:hypothetical protein D3C71_1849690 [compost metagenome]
MFQRQALVMIGGIGEAVRMDIARQLAITHGQLLKIQTEARFEFEQGKMTRTSHRRLRY